MKETWKKRLKEHLPDRAVYLYLLTRQLPGFAAACIRDRNREAPKLRFYDDQETVDMLISQRKSLSRFGDGEIRWMFGVDLPSFQSYSPELAEELTRVFQSRDENLLIGIPRGVVDCRECNLYAKMHWRTIRGEFYSRILLLADRERIYCNASITRPYIDYHDRQASARRFENLRRLWQGRDIVIVEGERSKLGVGNDLFSNAASLRRILCPATNAYEKIDAIEAAIRTHASKEDLLLAALGPTATVLAARMCAAGYQMVDIGHIDVEYIWYLRGDLLRKPIAGKHVLESGVTDCPGQYEEEVQYQSSTLCRVL